MVRRSLGYGLLVWLIPFLVAVGFCELIGLKSYNETLFASIMPVVLATSVMFGLILYFRLLVDHYLRHALAVGIMWLSIN